MSATALAAILGLQRLRRWDRDRGGDGRLRLWQQLRQALQPGTWKSGEHHRHISVMIGISE